MKNVIGPTEPDWQTILVASVGEILKLKKLFGNVREEQFMLRSWLNVIRFDTLFPLC